MAISNSKYDEIMREYEMVREETRHTLLEHKEEVYKKIPDYRELENKIADIAMESAAKFFDGDTKAISDMKKKMAEITETLAALLLQYDFPSDYLTPKHKCSDCEDTGYIDGKKCHCLRQKILKLLYRQSNIEEMLERENFDTLSYDYYDDGDLDKMNAIIGNCKAFVNDFDDKYENILLFGNVGVGKTFLTNCMAKALIDTGHSVIYFTSIRLFDTLSDSVFRKDYDDESEENSVIQDIFSCDLLIIDDLGTENVNTFVASRLFDILNERDLRHKSTIISTNLTVGEIAERYSERNFSRIFGNYRILNPTVGDIRVRKARG